MFCVRFIKVSHVTGRGKLPSKQVSWNIHNGNVSSRITGLIRGVVGAAAWIFAKFNRDSQQKCAIYQTLISKYL
jgi:hypothetical protein